MENGNFSLRLSLAAAHNIKERDYWLEQLSGDLYKSTFPYDYYKKEEENKKTRRARVKFRFPGALFAKTAKLSKGSAVKLHMILVTGSVILLSKYNQNDSKNIMIGSPILKQKKMGEFINKALVFRNRLEEDFSFKELLMQVRETIIKANENQNYPLEILPDQLNLVNAGNGFPFFDVVVLLRELHDEGYIKHINYDVLFSFSSEGESIAGYLEYNAGLYRKSTIEEISRRYMHLLDQVLTNVDIRLSQTELISEQEKKQVLTDFNNAAGKVEYPKNKTLHELFAEQVKRKPDNIALIANSIGAEEQPAAAKGQLRSRRYTLTYKELNSQAHRLALKLRFKGVKPETIVGIIVDPSVEMMVGLLAILKAGGAYLPIDPDLPPDRIDFMLKDSGTAIIVTNRDDLIRQLHRTVETQNFVLNGEPAQTSTLPTFYSPENLAYIIYTSGTTGKPKGVMVEHGNVVAYLHAFFCEFAITENHTAIQIASYAFDVFIEEVFPVLLRGGKIFIPHAVEIMDIELLSRLIYEQHVDILDCTPLLLNEFNNPNIIIKFLKYIRIIISGGDVLKWSYIDKLMEVGQVYNTYGPTESTVCATYYKLNGGKDEWEHRSLPIGKPVSNYKVYISDKKGRPVPIGFNGELCVAGPGITRGYLNRPELTAEKFTAVGEGSGRLYKTGDLARWLPDGSIEFSGRVDNQVKLRGFRIELGEIENCLRSHKKIEEAILMIRDDSKGDKFLCAYIVPRKVGFVKWSGNHPPLSGIVPAPPTIEAQSLREFLSAGLPYYMVPSHFVFIDEIPLNRNGKIDRKKLLEPKFDTSAEFIPPRTPVEKMMANIYSELLRIDVEKIGINDNFFELGGNSLNLIKLTTKIREVFGSNIPLTQILRDATVKQTANLILGSKLKSGEDDIMFLLNRINPENVFCFPPAVAHGLVYMGFAGLLQDYSVYAFNFINNKKLIELYVDNIIRVQPNGPYVLFAYSAGGKFALKTANLLEKKGYKVSAVILMECYIEIEKAKSADFEQKAIEYFENFKTILLDLGGDSLVEEVTVRVKDYQVFFNDLKRFDAINAPIYYISAENSREKKECLGWENLTRSEYKVYDGFGEHERMLEFVYIEKNVEIVKKILGHTK